MTTQQEQATKVAETVLANLSEIEEVFEYYCGTNRMDLARAMRQTLDAGRDYERRKYMG